ncbi:glycosyl hydrolase family 20, catalytic domain-containing protein [Ditylenchus destructor]|nr:glycosyl hydrolase family 20, catalytic domain-containing protein [Ditylenchus destructor]
MLSWLRSGVRVRKPTLWLFLVGKSRWILGAVLTTCFVYTLYTVTTSGSRAVIPDQNLLDYTEQRAVVRDGPIFRVNKIESGHIRPVGNVNYGDQQDNVEDVKFDSQDSAAKISDIESAPRPKSFPFRTDMVMDEPKPRSLSKLKGKQINGEEYPRLTKSGKFVPIRRFVHIDMKGAPYKPSFFPEVFAFLKRVSVTGVVLEWEDMFPYTGRLANAVNGDAYTIEQVEMILNSAKQQNLEIVPLAQTFGHLEWILKLKEFAHLREDKKFPQVICIGKEEVWELLRDMVDQVAKVHQKYGLNYFHMGADEVYQLGYCNETIAEMQKQGGRERVMLWHISRMANYIKQKYKVTVLAWHDMFVHVMEEELFLYNMTKLLEPVLWSYAEDLEQYLPHTDWLALKPFKNVWGSSTYKGADGPMRFNSNPIHYIRNHESWTVQMTRVYREFDYFQGLIMSGWSRYDHLAVLCELFPVGIPSLVMSTETILAGKPLNGIYPKSAALLGCQVPYEQGYVYGCNFPGNRIYELINEYDAQRSLIQRYSRNDFEFNGWLSNVAQHYNYSSAMYIEKIIPLLDSYLMPLEKLENDLREEMSKVYFPEAIDEFVLTYMSSDLQFLRKRKNAANAILNKRKFFEKRPYIKYPKETEL